MYRPSEWHHLGTLPRPTGDMPALSLDNRFYVFGGAVGEEVCDTVWSIDVLTGNGHEAGRMAYASRAHQAVLLGAEIYILDATGAAAAGGPGRRPEDHTVFLIGGMAEDEPDQVPVVDLTTGEIRLAKDLLEGRVAPAAGCVERRLIVAGGVVEPLFGMTDSIESATVLRRDVSPLACRLLRGRRLRGGLSPRVVRGYPHN